MYPVSCNLAESVVHVQAWASMRRMKIKKKLWINIFDTENFYFRYEEAYNKTRCSTSIAYDEVYKKHDKNEKESEYENDCKKTIYM